MSVKGGMKFGVGDNSGSGESIFRLPPFYYMHVLDLNKNVTRVELGPQTYIRQDNERVVQGPDRMITVAPRHYCIIENHVLRDEAGNALTDTSGQVRLAHADLEIRLAQDPFPLYPGEKLKTPPTALRIVPADSALRLKATLDFEEENGEKRVAGDEWLFEGPGTYIPRKEVSVEETVRATTILPNQALRLRARRETLDRQGNSRVTGEEWLIAKVSVKKTVRATTILPSQALRLRARRNTLDRQGNSRVTGEEWLIAEVGAYLPGAYEEVVHVVSAHVLTDKTALHVRALRTHKDQFGKTRKNGEEWLVRMSDAETYIPDVYEEVVDEAGITILTNREYCFVLNPIGADDKPQFGKRKLVKGERSFFLQPGEALEAGIQDIYVLDETEGLILRANEGFTDGDTERSPGDRWMIRGPLEYVPPVEVEVVDRRAAIPLDENEGIYVRDIKTGKVRAVIGETYLLTQDEMLWSKSLPGAVESLLSPSASTLPFLVPGKGASLDRPGVGASFNAVQAYITAPPPRLARPSMRGVPTQGGLASFGMTNCIRQDESLWEKELPAAVEGLLGSGKDPLADRGHRHAPESAGSTPGARDRTRVVTFRVPHNAAVQIYDYKEKHARVTFGPELVMLSPDEHFTQLSLSGGKPKRPNVIKSLCLLLGPDFCTDIVTVETSDHARLSLQLSYNWHFDSGEKSQTVAAKLFSVPDFVGDACKAIASRVRGMVAQVAFDDFHKNSARIIRSAVFGMDSDNKVRDRFVFSQNQLVVTSIDIQSVEPVDQKTRDSLMKSVQLAIEITTNSQEATARHEAERIEQEAKGRLERQKISDEAEAEKSRKELLELQALSAAVESTGQAKEAKGRLERQKISDEAEAEKSRKELLELQALSAAVESTGQAKAEAQSQAESARIEGEAAVEMSRLKAEASKIDTESELNRLKAAREAELVYLKEKNSLEVSRAREMAEIDTNKFGQAVNVLGTSTIQAIACAGPEMQVKLLQGLGLQTALITDGSSPINLFNTAQGLVGGGNMGALMGQPKPKE